MSPGGGRVPKSAKSVPNPQKRDPLTRPFGVFYRPDGGQHVTIRQRNSAITGTHTA
jgi:hypothetical protein